MTQIDPLRGKSRSGVDALQLKITAACVPHYNVVLSGRNSHLGHKHLTHIAKIDAPRILLTS